MSVGSTPFAGWPGLISSIQAGGVDAPTGLIDGTATTLDLSAWPVTGALRPYAFSNCSSGGTGSIEYIWDFPSTAITAFETSYPYNGPGTWLACLNMYADGCNSSVCDTVQFDAKNLAATRIAIDVPVASATLDSEDADAELPKADWFDAAAFPQASFVLNDAKAIGQGRYEVQGSLRIKGLSLPIKSSVQMTQNQGITWASGSFRISRLAYKIGSGPWGDTSVVADPVDVKYKIAISGISSL